MTAILSSPAFTEGFLHHPDRIEEVARLLQRRVVVYGKAYLSQDGNPLWIKADDFRGLPNPDELVSVLDMPPLELPGGLDAVEYVRRIRNGESL